MNREARFILASSSALTFVKSYTALSCRRLPIRKLEGERRHRRLSGSPDDCEVVGLIGWVSDTVVSYKPCKCHANGRIKNEGTVIDLCRSSVKVLACTGNGALRATRTLHRYRCSKTPRKQTRDHKLISLTEEDHDESELFCTHWRGQRWAIPPAQHCWRTDLCTAVTNLNSTFDWTAKQAGVTWMSLGRQGVEKALQRLNYRQGACPCCQRLSRCSPSTFILLLPPPSTLLHSSSQLTRQLIDIHQPVNAQSVSLSINRSVNQSIIQLINQPINQSII